MVHVHVQVTDLGDNVVSSCSGEEAEGEETDDEYENAEPTQAYHCDGGLDEEDGEPMDIEPTVAYNITGE